VSLINSAICRIEAKHRYISEAGISDYMHMCYKRNRMVRIETDLVAFSAKYSVRIHRSIFKGRTGLSGTTVTALVSCKNHATIWQGCFI
jgi:hypothetical protein